MGVTGSRVRRSATLTVQKRSERPKASPPYWRIANGFAENFYHVYFAKPTGVQTAESRS
jgi:hypothetical protein